MRINYYSAAELIKTIILCNSLGMSLKCSEYALKKWNNDSFFENKKKK